MGGMMGLPEGPALALELQNKTEEPLWVTVSFEAPNPTERGEITDKIEARGQYLFTHLQHSITPDTDYPIRLHIYTDAAHSQLVESPDTKFRFSQRDAKVFERLTAELNAKSRSR
jgi:hypothetical protein